MSPEDRLDVLLSRVRVGKVPAPLSAEEQSLAPLLEAAARVSVTASATPRPAFADELERRLLARAGAIANEQRSSMSATAAPAAVSHAATTTRFSMTGGRSTARRWWHARVAQAMAAAVVLAIGTGGVFTAAAMAAPGNPLFALHRWEQGVRAALGTSAADRAQTHLQYLKDALTALDAAVLHHDGGAYRDALATVRDEDGAAAREIGAMPAAGDRDALAAQLATFRARERASLRAALASPLEWTSRLQSTQALGGLGEQVPTIASITAERADPGDAHTWRIVLVGTGFQPGAVFALDGKPIGAVQTLTSTQMVVLWSGNVRDLPDGAPGIVNPDGSAAATGTPRPDANDGQDDSSTPGASGTPGKGDGHGGDHGGTGGNKGATPTATVVTRPTESANGTPTPAPGGDGSQ